MLLFSLFFFCLLFFLEKSLRMYVDTCQVSTRASAVTVCFCDKCVCKISKANVWDNTAEPKQSGPTWQKQTSTRWMNEFWVWIWRFPFTSQSRWVRTRGRREGRVKLDPLERGTCHVRWSCSIWFKAVCLLFEAVNVGWGKQEECKVDTLPLDNTVSTQCKTLTLSLSYI